MGEQRRHKGEFVSEYSDEQLYKLVRLVAQQARPDETARLTQAEFDANSAEVAEKNELPPPPTAVAVYLRFKPKRWRQIVTEAVDEERSDVQTIAAATREEEAPWLDEAGAYYALTRVASFINAETLTEASYDRGRDELIGSVGPRQAELLREILPTSGQLRRLASGDWNLLVALAGMAPPKVDLKAHPLVKLAWHFYETKSKLPSDKTLREYCNKELKLAMPRSQKAPWSQHMDELRAARAERGWSTPADGPPEGERLTEAELAALLEGAPPYRERGYWAVRQRVMDAFCEFVEEFHGRKPLRLRLYLSHREERSWPSNQAYAQHGTFSELVDEAVKIVVTRRKKAA